MKSKSLKLGILSVMIILAVLIGLQTNSGATPYLALTINNGTPVFDNGAGDLNPLPGVLTFSGAVGNWIINVTTGITYLDGNTPFLDLNSVNVTSGGGGTLDITLSAMGYTLLNGGATLDIGGTTSGAVEANAYYGTSLFSKTNQIGSQLTFGTGAFSGSTSGAGPSVGPYSLTIDMQVTHSSSGTQWKTSSFDSSLAVPEPGSLLLLGTGLLGLGFAIRRRAKK